jgi:hypothetical protein
MIKVYSRGLSAGEVLAEYNAVETNAAPTISGALVTSDDITPSYNNDFTVWCNATVEDTNGYEDVTGANATLWDPATAAETDGDDTDEHYTNSSCTLAGGAGNTVNAQCAFTVKWFAQPAEWTCKLTAVDTGSETGTTTATDLTINSFKGVGGGTSLNFGSMSPGDTTATESELTLSIENRGNIELDVNITSAGDLACASGTIDDANIHYNTSQVAYASMCAVGSYCAETETNFDLRKRNSGDGSNPSNTVYWGIQIPSGVGGACSTTTYYGTV